MLTVDENVFLWINGLSGHFAPLDWLLQRIANDYFILVGLCLVLLALWLWGGGAEQRDKNQRAVICASISLGIAQGFVSICNLFCFRTRPFDVLPTNLLFYQPTDSSFPSNSVTVLFAAAFAIFLVNRKAGGFMLALAGLHAFSRVYVGIHYPLDVLAGAAMGTAIAFLVTLAIRALKKQLDFVMRLARLLYLA
ncbi:phosphatase PAP2 family protein [Chloroflexota bacterium]